MTALDTIRETARRAVLQAEIRPPSRWVTLTETSPSGKTMFRCGTCGLVTTAPNKRCGVGCEDG